VVKVSMHQVSALSLFLFVIVVETLSREFRVALPWELLFADDLVEIVETEGDLITRLNEWKDNMKNRGVSITIREEWQKVMQNTLRWPCGVCG